MTKAKLEPILPRNLSQMAWNRDSRRNALGTVRKEHLDQFIEDFAKACEAAGVSCSSWVKRKGTTKETRLEIFNGKLQQEIDELGKRPSGVLGLFFDEAFIYQPDGTKELDPDRLVLFIYFTIKKKALTRFRNFLLNHIVEVEEPVRQVQSK